MIELGKTDMGFVIREGKQWVYKYRKTEKFLDQVVVSRDTDIWEMSDLLY